MSLNTYLMSQSSILRLFDQQDDIDFNPHYQRSSGVWSRYNQQLLIDSILNDFDLPKIYLHARTGQQEKAFSVVDGKQRLEAIFGFIRGDFKLSNDFRYLEDDSVKAAGLNYNQLGQEYPRLKVRFDTHTLPVVVVETEDIDLIEDMFWRLNEASPLYAAEKRNAIGGGLVKAIRTTSDNKFFRESVRFGNKRQQHSEVAVRILYLTHCIIEYGRLYDTKKAFLDGFARDYKTKRKTYINHLSNFVNRELKELASVFETRDPLLASQSIVPIYFLCRAHMGVRGINLVRSRLEEFHSAVSAAKETFSDIDEYGAAESSSFTRGLYSDYELVRFSTLSAQGTNDAGSIKDRTNIILEFLNVEPDWTLLESNIKHAVATSS